MRTCRKLGVSEHSGVDIRVLEHRGVGIYECRNIGGSEPMDVGIYRPSCENMSCRNIGVSEFSCVTLMWTHIITIPKMSF